MEVRIRRRSGTGTAQETGRGNATVRPKEKRVGVLTKRSPVAPRTRRMMMAGPLSAAEHHPLHLIGPDDDLLVFPVSYSGELLAVSL